MPLKYMWHLLDDSKYSRSRLTPISTQSGNNDRKLPFSTVDSSSKHKLPSSRYPRDGKFCLPHSKIVLLMNFKRLLFSIVCRRRCCLVSKTAEKQYELEEKE